MAIGSHPGPYPSYPHLRLPSGAPMGKSKGPCPISGVNSRPIPTSPRKINQFWILDLRDLGWSENIWMKKVIWNLMVYHHFPHWGAHPPCLAWYSHFGWWYPHVCWLKLWNHIKPMASCRTLSVPTTAARLSTVGLRPCLRIQGVLPLSINQHPWDSDILNMINRHDPPQFLLV